MAGLSRSGRPSVLPLPGGDTVNQLLDQLKLSTLRSSIWHGQCLTEDVREVQWTTYFPRSSVRDDSLAESQTTSRCPWKVKARYWHVVGEIETATDAAFAYENPWPLARRLVTDRIAFWHDVEVTND